MKIKKQCRKTVWQWKSPLGKFLATSDFIKNSEIDNK